MGNAKRHGMVGRLAPWLVLPAVLLALAATVACQSGFVFAGSGPWLGSALCSRLFVTCAAIGGVCALLLTLLVGAMWRMGAAGRPPRGGQGGAAMLEFALVFPLALFLVLIMAQSSMLMGGKLCVNYAAFCATRSAIVMVPYEDTTMGEGGESANVYGPNKQAKIRDAALWALMPVSCSLAQVDSLQVSSDTNLQQGLSRYFQMSGTDTPGWIGLNLSRRWRYADAYTQVVLAPPENGGQYGPHDDLTVNVTHVFYLSVPYANRVFAWNQDDGVKLDFAPGEYGLTMKSNCRLTNEGVRDHPMREPPPPPDAVPQ